MNVVAFLKNVFNTCDNKKKEKPYSVIKSKAVSVSFRANSARKKNIMLV